MGVVLLVFAELVTLYAYSLLWLAEGQPRMHGDPRLQSLAWVCVAAMLLEPVAFGIWIVRRR